MQPPTSCSKNRFKEILDVLTEREQILKMRFGLDDGKSHTLEEVGQEFSVTRERIRQIEAKALAKLRKHKDAKKLYEYFALAMRISIVLPAYNEADGIRYCLDSIAAQSEPAFEVIVIDNNSTDDTAAIARSYPFVTYLNEAQQGITPATRRSFRACRGDVLALMQTSSWSQTGFVK